MTLSAISRSQKLLEKVNFQVFTMFVVEDINQTNSVRAALYVVYITCHHTHTWS